MRCNVLAAKGGRRRNDQVPRRLVAAFGNQQLRAVQLAQRLLALLHEHRALLRHRYAARRPVQQLHAQAGFQRVDAASDHDGRHVLREGGSGHAAVFHHGDERFDLLELVHSIIPVRNV